jgi:lambda family phage tail tape measure protein
MDIAELGYSVDSSGLIEGEKALDRTAAAADKAGTAAERMGSDFTAMSKAIDQSSKALGDRLGGALDRIGVGTGLAVAELQTLNKTQSEMLTYLTSLDQKLVSAGLAMQQLGQAGSSAAKGTQEAATASQRLEQELAQQEARLKSVAQAGVAWAESNRNANLSDRALAEAAQIAASGIDVQARAMAGAGSEADRLAAKAKILQEAEARAANEAREAAQATERQALNLKQLLGQIDPTIAKLDKLADMEERLEKAADLGMIKPAQFQQFQGQIDATRAKLLNAGKGSDEFTGSLGRLNLKSAETMRNLSQLVSATATGNFGLAGNQVLQLGTSAGATGLLFSGAGAAVAGFTALVIAGVAAWKQGQDELFDFQKNLILTGRNAEVSEAQFQGLVDQLDSLVGVSRGQAVDALSAVSASSKLVGQNMDLVAAAAARMEASTGQAISKTVSWFEEIAKDPVEGILKLSDAVGGLDRAQLARIVTLQQEGQEQQAVAEAMVIAKDRLDELADRSEAVMPPMVQWWRDVKNEASGAWGEVVTFTGHVNDLATTLASKMPAAGAALKTMFNAMLPSTQLGQLNSWLSGGALPTPLYDPEEDSAAAKQKKLGAETVQVLKEQALAEKAASDALNSRLSGLDRVSAKQAALNTIIETYNKLSDNDPRHFDGSMARLIAKSNADIDKQFNQREGLTKANTDDNSAQSFVANIQRQITANEQLAASGEKVTASDRLVIQARQLLADKTNTMTAATRSLLQALIPTLETTDAQAQAEVQRQRDLQSSIALTDRLAQIEKQRQDQADLDLMSIGLGTDESQVLQRQLDIQRKYFDEMERLKRQQNGDHPLGADEYAAEVSQIEASLGRVLDIERNYQSQRMAALGDWRTGFSTAWKDYAFAAADASSLAAGALTNALGGMEDAFVQLATTGKISFRSLADSIIADLARIAAKQLITGLVGNLFAGIGGQSAAATQGYVDDYSAIYGGGRAAGGPVSRGSYYEVGEQNRPELLQQGGKSYLIPGNDGQVIPMAASSSGGSGQMRTPQININVQGDANVESASASQNSTGGFDVTVILKHFKNAIAEDISSGTGSVTSALKGRYGLKATV